MGIDSNFKSSDEIFVKTHLPNPRGLHPKTKKNGTEKAFENWEWLPVVYRGITL